MSKHKKESHFPKKIAMLLFPLACLFGGLGLAAYQVERQLTPAAPFEHGQQTSPPTRRHPPLVPLRQYFKPDQTFAFTIPQLKPLRGVGAPRASTCRHCHTNHDKEWSRSTHAAALSDLQYQAELAKPSSPAWLCLNCHTPIQNQRPSVIHFLVGRDVFHPLRLPNPKFDPKMRREAITCASCHVRQRSDGESVIIGSIGSKYAPHPVKKDRRFLRRVCLRCHDPKGKRLTRHLLCWFKTRKELAEGPFAGKEDCVSCHMPKTRRKLVPARAELPTRTSFRHSWVGGGVPKQFDGYSDLLARGYKPGVDLQLTHLRLPAPTHSPDQHTQLSFTLSITNARAGHWMPTGDPERFVKLLAKLYNSAGQCIKQTSYRIGQIWRWEPRAEKLGDNRLKPLERRDWHVQLSAARATKLVLLAYHVRLSTQTAQYMQRQAPKQPRLPADARKKLLEIGKHYPLATLLYREEIDLRTGKRTRDDLPTLLKRSYQERHKPLHKRDY